MRIPLRGGRSFTEHDAQRRRELSSSRSACAALLARRGRDWQRLSFQASVPQVWNEIVGIVGDVKHERLDADPKRKCISLTSNIPTDS